MIWKRLNCCGLQKDDGDDEMPPAVVETPSKPKSTIKWDAAEVPRISLLWDEAYQDLKDNEETKTLMKEYEDYFNRQLPEGETIPDTPSPQRYQQIGKILQKRQKEIESNQWKVKNFQGEELFKVKDFVEPVVSVIEWSKDWIGDAVKAGQYPPVSFAWTGVCTLLPVSTITLSK
jgi:N-terminal domain of NWD NACHT-NTPase